MDNALYVGLSKQVLLERELDIAANNLANVNTTGFKVEALMSAPDPVTPPALPSGAAPIQFVADNGVARDFSQGPLQPTERAAGPGDHGPGLLPDSDRERHALHARRPVCEGQPGASSSPSQATRFWTRRPRRSA